MVDKDTHRHEAGPKQTKVVGTGPFMFVEWVQGDHLTLREQPELLANGKPYLDGLQANVRDIQSATLQLEAGALDLIRNPLVDDVARLEQDPHYTKVLHPNPGTFFEYGLDCTQAAARQQDACARRSTTRSTASGWSTCSGQRHRRRPAVGPELARLRRGQEQALRVRPGQGARRCCSRRGASRPGPREHHHPRLVSRCRNLPADLPGRPGQDRRQADAQAVDAATWLDQANNVKYKGMWASGDNYANLNPGSLFAVSPGWRVFPNNDGFKEPALGRAGRRRQHRSRSRQAESPVRRGQRLHPGPVLHLRRLEQPRVVDHHLQVPRPQCQRCTRASSGTTPT